MSILGSARNAVKKENKKTTKYTAENVMLQKAQQRNTTKTTSTQSGTTKKNTQNVEEKVRKPQSTSIIESAYKAVGKERKSGTIYSSTPKTSYRGNIQNPKDYSSTVKYLEAKGVRGASGIMTENEWRRRKGASENTYQDYLDGVINKYGKGNIDLTARPQLKNDDGTYSTVDSIGIFDERDRKQTLIPTVIYDNGEWKHATEDEAIQHYLKTGEHLGKFDTIEAANAHAQQLHIDQENYYNSISSDASGWEIAKNSFFSGLGTFNKGLFSTLDFILPTEILGKYDFVSKLNDYYSNEDDYWKQQKAESVRGKSNTTKIIADVGEGTVAALPNAILAIMTGGASSGTALTTTTASTGFLSSLGNTARATLKNPMYWTSVAQTLGTDYEEAKANGANEFVASASAIIKSTLNAGIEIGGGIETLPKNLKSGGKSLIVEWVKSMLEEGKEEVVQGIVSNCIDKIMYAYDKDIVSLENEDAIINPVRMGKEFGMGAAIGGVLGGAQMGAISGVNALAKAQANKQYKNGYVNSEIDTEPTTLEQAAIDVVNERNRTSTPSNTTVSEENSTNSIQQTTAPATLEQAAIDVVNERNRTSTPSYTRLEALSRSNEPIAVEDVKKATGFGDEGSKMVAELANSEGMTFSQAERAVKTAYLAGSANVESAKVNFETDTQINAYTAGRKDRAMQDLAMKENAKSATIYKGAFTENKYTKNFTKAEKTMISTVAKSFGMDVSVVDKVIANKYTGAEANASHQDGKMEISSTAQKVVSELVLHEGGHRMRQLAPTEFGVLMNALYKRADGRNINLGVSQGLRFDEIKTQHDNAGITMNTSGYIEEVAVRELEKIFSSPKEFNKWYAEISGNKNVRTAWQKFVDFITEIIENVKQAIAMSKMSKEERAEAKKDLAEFERIKELYANAYKAAENAVAERANSAKNLEIKTNQVYNGNINHSLKSKYNEYNTIGMQWAYDSDTQIGDLNVLYNKYTGKYVLVKATKEDVGFIEMRTGTLAQMRKEREYYATEKERLERSKETVDKVLRDSWFGRNNSDGNNVDVGNRRTGKQNAELFEGKSNSHKTTDTRTTDGELKKNFSLKETAPTFYSHMGKTIDGIKQEKIGANSVVSYLKGRGVKDEEIKWSGIETFLDGKKSVTKAELQEFVAGSMLQIDVKTVENDITISYTQEELEDLDRTSKALDKAWVEANDIWNEAYGTDIPFDILGADDVPSAMVRYVINQHGGMSNFEGISHLSDAERKIYGEYGHYSTNSITQKIKDLEEHQAYIAERAKARRDNTKQTKYHKYTLDGGSGNYRELLFKLPNSEYTNAAMSSHWGDKGILAHARVQDFEADGGKMLFIEEIQSDWHNEGQRKNYESDISYEERREFDALTEKITKAQEQYDSIHKEKNDLAFEYFRLENLSFEEYSKKTYPLIAAEEKAQRKLDRLNKERDKIGDKIENAIPDAPFRNNYHEYVLKSLIRMAAEQDYDSIGWTAADIQSKRWSEKYAEGYRIEYDQDIPKFLNKYGKKWGAKVGKTEIGKEDGGWYEVEGTTVWTMPITDSMKESVLYEGQPMFSLKESVEETKNLIAVHNTTEKKLLGALKLGGLPSPSIAITKNDMSHEKFGDISLVFRKDSISPTDRRNKIYSGDAYTPTGVRVEYDVDDDILQEFNKRLKELTPEWSKERLPSVDSGTAEAENDSLYNAYERNDRAKFAFLREKGKAPKIAMRTPRLSYFVSNDTVIALAKAFSTKQLIDIANTSEGVKQYKNAFLKVIRDTEDSRIVASGIYSADEASMFDIAETASKAKQVKENKYKIKKEIDLRNTSELIDKKFTKALKEEYRKWIDENTKDAIIDKGIRNNRDLFTPSGKRRTFKQLHEPYNLSNIIKQMFSGEDKGIALFGGSPIGAAQHEYSRIADVKADSGRIQQLEQEEYDKIRDEIEGDVLDLAQRMKINSDVFTVRDLLSEAIGKKTKQQADTYLKREAEGWAKYSPDFTNELWDIRNRILSMPTEYFEAKPQRAVDFNEVVLAVVPKGKTVLRKQLENAGVQKVVYYDKAKDGDRLAKLNSVPDVNFSLKETDTTSSKDRKELLDIIEHLKGEFEITKLAKADPKKLAKMTKDILKEYSSQVDYDETYKAIDELYLYMANGEDGHPAVWEDVYNRAYDIAQEIVSNALVVDDYMYQEYKSLRNYLRTTPMKFYSDYDSSPIAYENFNEFRKSNFGRLKFTKDGMAIDSVYQELSSLYPEFFDAERDNNTSDQLERIVEVLDEIQPTELNPYDREIRQASMFLANDVINRFFDIPQAKPTFADKAERRVIDARIAGAKKVEAVRQQKDAKIQKLLEAQKEKTKKQLNKLRQQRDDKVKKEQAKRRDAISKMSENQKAKVLRAQIMRHAGELSKKLVSPTDNQHIPQELQGAVAKLLECINLESNYTYDTESHSYKKNDEGLPSRRTQAFNELRDLYSKIADTVVVDPDLMGEGGLLSDVISLADKRIADMNSSELDTVWQALRAVEASVNTANKMFSQGKFETILEFAENLREDNAGKKPRIELAKWAGGGIKRLAQLDMLTPETYFHYLGSAGDSIFRMMRNAQDKHISIMKEVADFTHKTLKDVDVNSLEKTLHNVKLGGKDVKLSTAQLMELYVLMKREQAVDHILLGGILPDTTENKLNPKLNVSEKAIRNLSMAEITEALSNLTDEQKKIADALQKFVSTTLSEYGNEASMQVYNYEKFTEKNYWTLRVNKKDLSNKEVGEAKKVVTVANKGMAKGTKPHANNSVRIGSIFDTFATHSSDMATYAAWLGTSEDVNRIRNFVFWENGARVESIEDILDTVHGAYESKGSKYLEKLLEDISIGVKGTDNMNPFDKFIGTYKAASVGANVRVVIQQPTAILRALDMIDARYLTEGAVRPLKGWEKAKKYAPIAQWKDWGHFDINTGRQMKDVLFDNASLLEKTKQAGMWGASMADSLAWGQLWNAAEAETKAKHKELKVGTEEYYETVAKRFTEIVDHTQVVDGILQRSQLMRATDGIPKMATAFMGEPTKQYNMAMSAAYDAKNLKGDARKKAVAKLGRTALSLAVAGIINACAQSIIDAMRDDDKEKDYWEKWLSAFKGDEDDKWFQKFGNIGDTANPLNYVPFVKDIVSVFSGYDVKRMDMESISKISNAVINMYKAITGTGKYTIAEASAQLFAETARLYGLPVANVKRDVKSLAMTVAIETDSYLMQYRMEKAMLKINYAGNGKNFIDILFNAYNNDKEAYRKIYSDMLESGYDVDKIKSGMEARMKKAEGVKKASELTKRYMTPADEKKYDSGMKQIRSSQIWKSANAEQKKDAKSDLYNFLTSNSDDMKKTREEAKAAGVDETEYTLWRLAIEMADQPKGEKGSGSYDSKEKAEAINSLNLGNEEIAYFYGKGLDEYAKEELNETLNAGIDLQEYVNFKAATSEMKADKNANGKSIPNSKKRKVVNYLNNANLTNEEWNYFYYEIMNYKK